MPFDLPAIGTVLGRLARTEAEVPHDFEVVTAQGPIFTENIGLFHAFEKARYYLGGAGEGRHDLAMAIFGRDNAAGGAFRTQYLGQAVHLRAVSDATESVRTLHPGLVEVNGLRTVSMTNTHPAALGVNQLLAIADRRGAAVALRHVPQP